MPQGMNYGRPSGKCKEIPALRILSANGLITEVKAQPLSMMQRNAARTSGGILLAACQDQCWAGKA